MTNYKRHQEVKAAQERQSIVNTAKFVAYATGCYDGGWLAECSGHVDGFRSDYMLVHSNPANLSCHKVSTIHVLPGEQKEYAEYLDEVLADCAKENDGDKPEVVEITDADIAAAKTELRRCYAEYVEGEENSDRTAKTMEEWLDDLLGNELDETTPDTATLAENSK